MDALGQLQKDLLDALAHLYDPTYRPTGLLCAALSCDPALGMGPVQQALIRLIQGLQPSVLTPPTARSRRLYELLSYTYLQQLTQEQTSERLGITARHLRREKQQAVGLLARTLWERAGREGQPGQAWGTTAEGAPSSTTDPDPAWTEWRSQMMAEVASLRKSAPGSVADIGETLRGVQEIAQALASRHGVRLNLGALQPQLSATLHPSALRQLILAGITELLRGMSAGEIEISAFQEGESHRIVMAATPAGANVARDDRFLRELLAAQRGVLENQENQGQVTLSLVLPMASKVNVLVVDDNPDLVHFFRRYAVGTRYEISALGGGEHIFEAIQALTPQIIVLDVMLPDRDGWELLSQLHEHPATRSIPVIVCTVVREEELALTLGASLYVAKPVGRQAFIQALDQVLSRAATASSRAHASSATAC